MKHRQAIPPVPGGPRYSIDINKAAPLYVDLAEHVASFHRLILMKQIAIKEPSRPSLPRRSRVCLVFVASLATALSAYAQPAAAEGGKDGGADAAAKESALASLKTLEGFDGKQWTNSLGMKFAPVPGTKVAFCTWETRVRDYALFAAATNADASWKEPGFPQTPDPRW